MKKILVLASLSFVSLGYYILLSQPKTHETQLIWDWQEYCDHDTYKDKYFFEGQSYLDEEQAQGLANIPVDSNKYIAILKNQSLHEIFKAHHVSFQEIAALTKVLSSHVRAQDIAVGDFYNFELSNTSDKIFLIKSFTLKKLDQNRLPITYNIKRKNLDTHDTSFLLTLNSPQITEKLETFTITIKDTLFESFASLAYGNELMQAVLGVLAWRMKLPEHVNKNDQIQILVKSNYADNKFLGYNKIQALSYTQAHQTINAFYFASQDKKIEGYFDEQGVSLEKEFLVSPVANSTATSSQQLRFHPVYKTRMRHNGTDYRGVIGTTFFSIADGEIIEKRFDKNVGFMIRIRHKYGVHSEYFHADSLVENLRVGSRVKRGQKVGEIGRTGLLCTGPHLHMGLYKLDGEKRKYINLSSLRNQLVDQPSLNNIYRAEFSKITQHALAQALVVNKFKNSGEILEN
jgi:murein DD-endopeptidase MepM/ murein hydrolase activator NlpD